MIDSRKCWTEVLDDEDTLAALRRAARACMADVAEDEDPPKLCGHREVDLMTPVEFVEWLERALHARQEAGHTTLARSHMREAKVIRGPLRMVGVG